MALNLSNIVNMFEAVIGAKNYILCTLDDRQHMLSHKETQWSAAALPDTELVDRIDSLLEKLEEDWNAVIIVAPAVANCILREAFKKLVMAALHEAAILASENRSMEGPGDAPRIEDMMTAYIRDNIIQQECPSCPMVYDLMKVVNMRDVPCSLDADLMQTIAKRLAIIVSIQMEIGPLISDDRTAELLSMEEAAASAMSDDAAEDETVTDDAESDDAESDDAESDDAESDDAESYEPAVKRPRRSKEERYAMWCGMVVAMIAIAKKYRDVIENDGCWFEPKPFKKAIEDSGANTGPSTRNGSDLKIVRDHLMFTRRVSLHDGHYYRFDLERVDKLVELLPEQVKTQIDIAEVKFKLIELKFVESPPVSARLVPMVVSDCDLMKFVRNKLTL